MYRKILVGGLTAAAIVGVGGAAMAISGSAGTPGTPVTTVSAQDQTTDQYPRLDRARRFLRHVSHGQIVTQSSSGFVTHDVIVGRATAASATSITVRAADGTTQTYAVNSDTRVRVLGDGAPGLSSIDEIDSGDRVAVAGTGTSPMTAQHVLKLPAG